MLIKCSKCERVSSLHNTVSAIFCPHCKFKVRNAGTNKFNKHPGRRDITVHWDFNDGSELSSSEVGGHKKFNTHDLDFFNKKDNVTILRKDGRMVGSKVIGVVAPTGRSVVKMLADGADLWEREYVK